MPTMTPGSWRVTRLCCRDGHCGVCLAKGNRTKRVRIVIQSLIGIDEDYARFAARYWPGDYEAQAELMPQLSS